VYTITKRIKFEAAHNLEAWTHSKCHNLHGHSWELEVTLASPRLDNSAVMDLEEIGNVLHDLIFVVLDHQYINEVLGEDNPTCEFLAGWAWMELKPVLPLLKQVRVQETTSGWATYSEGAGEEGSRPN